MKWWSHSRESKCTCGALSMVRARSWKFLFSPSATRMRPYDCYANSFVGRALSPRLSSPINCGPTERRFAKLASRDCTSRGCVPTIGRRTRISRFEGGCYTLRTQRQDDNITYAGRQISCLVIPGIGYVIILPLGTQCITSSLIEMDRRYAAWCAVDKLLIESPDLAQGSHPAPIRFGSEECDPLRS
jgi:hypothetical protein